VVVKTEECIQDELGIDCDQKVSLSLPVSYGLRTNMEALTEAGEAVSIEITKSMPEMVYPLTLFHTVSYFPYEEVIRVDNASPGVMACNDNPEALTMATCGDTYQGSQRIEHSQGFCCNKTSDQLSEASTVFRGEKLLGESSTSVDSFSTAHCLRLGDLNFHGYEIGNPRTRFGVGVELRNEGSGDVAKLHVSPEQPLVTDSSVLPLRIQLSEDAREFKQAPELANYILYIPASPTSHPYVQDWKHHMLLVPREEVSRDGSELNKVGTSFYAFRKMGSECRVSEAGDGLHNQLFQKHSADLETLNNNPKAETSYLVSGMRDFKDMIYRVDGAQKTMAFTLKDINYSNLELSMNAFGVPKMLEQESLGIIMDASVKDFTSMSERGNLVARIINYGDIKADYIVTVTLGNQNIIPAIPAQARTLAPQESADLRFDMHTAYNEDTSNEVLVTLSAPTGRVYDQIYVKFDTLVHQAEHSFNLMQENEASQSNP
jgi:hypothetical protein